VENNVTAPADKPADKTPEQIQAEMAATRESLTEKVAALENQVVGTVQTAADTFTGTVNAVKSLVTTAPEAVSETVKKAAEKMKEVLDVSGHVRNHPWTSVGVSAGLGFITGLLVFRGRQPMGYSNEVEPPPYTGAPTPTTLTPPRPPEEPREPGMFDEIFGTIRRKLREITENVINTATAAVNKNVSEGVPKLVDTATEMAAERLSPGGGESDPRFNRAGSYAG
jgi:ElaB/YqjD/DUF883 family membrane-anchored ribosome-binding protein